MPRFDLDAGWTSCFVRPRADVEIRCMVAKTAATPAHGTFIVAQGRSEYVEKYADVMRALNRRGFDAVAFDWRGQGLSSRLLANRHKGHIDDYGCYLQDLDAVLASLGLPADGAPLYALAHSMGGHIILRDMIRNPGRIAAAMLSAPMFDITASRSQRAMFHAVSGLAVRCGLAAEYAPGKGDYGTRDEDFAANRLTHDRDRFQASVDALRDNPALAIGGPTWGWLHATMRSIAALRAELQDWPERSLLCIVSAGQDTVVANAAQHHVCGTLRGCEMLTIDAALHEVLQEVPAIQAEFWARFDRFFSASLCEAP
jgi:lysophospholipase